MYRSLLRTTTIAAAIVVSSAACAHVASETGEQSHADIITSDDIERVHAVDAYDAIKKVHANFLSYRGRTSVTGTSNPDPTVYLDDVPFGVVSSLRTIPANQVATIRLYRAYAAEQKFGAGNMGGVIEVYTKH